MTRAPASGIVSLARYQNEQLARFRSNLSQAIATGDVEAVHDLRVASRRLHDALELMGACLGRKRIRRTQRSLKRVRKAFRKVRDLDVLRVSLSDLFGAGAAEADALAALESVLQRRRERAAAEAKRVGQRQRLTREVASVEDLTAAFTRLGAHEPTLIEEALNDMLRQRAAALARKDPRNDGIGLHETRICVKRTRYCAQLLQEYGCTKANELLEGLARMQTLLGHWNDQIVAARIISRLASRRRMLSTQTAASEKLLECAARRTEAAMADRQTAVEQWPALVALVRQSVPDLDDAETPETAVRGGDALEQTKGSAQYV
jgi:CHAD domain-containing protein